MIDVDHGGQIWSRIEHKYTDTSRAIQTYRKIVYDFSYEVEQWSDPLNENQTVPGHDYGNWNRIYKETTSQGTVVRHWYIDDLGQAHILTGDDSSNDGGQSGRWEESEPGSDSGGRGGDAGGEFLLPPLDSFLASAKWSDEFRY